MPDLIENPEPAPVPSPALPSKSWARFRLYLWAIVLILTMWFCAAIVTLRNHPERFVYKILDQMPYSYSTGKIFWINRRTLEIDDVKVGGFFYADSIIVTASPMGLWRHHIAKIRINGGQLFTKPLYAAMESTTGGGKGLDWVIGRLEISRGTLMLDNMGIDTSIPVRLGVRQPIVLNGLRLGKPDDNNPDMKREQVAEISNILIVSPFDPVAPVLAFPLTRIRFSYSEIWHHHIRQIDLIRPTMFLGEDLFWFSNQFQATQNSKPTQGPESPWEVGQFSIQYGQLAVNAFGQPVVHFPFFVDTRVNDIRLDQLDKISAKSVIAIRRLDQDYPDYKIKLEGLTGRLYFSVPITDDKANNVVNTISVEELSWNDIPVKGVSSTLTFDPTGIYGKLSGTCEGGILDGNFEFYYTKGFTWNTNFFANKINVQPIAEKLGGKYLNLTGQLDGKVAVQGRITDILNCQGSLSLPNPGVLEIKSMDELMNRLPADASPIKRDLMKIGINTFQKYPYTNGELKIDYKPAGGVGTLKLDSPLGGRQFEIYWHPFEESSKVAKDGDNR